VAPTVSPYQKVYNKQNETKLANTRQTQYVIELRDSNVGIATALLQPQSNQTYFKNTRNLIPFLEERGYDISNPDTIPNSIFSPTKSEGRNATMGDLERFEYQKDRNPDRSLIQFATPKVQQQRADARKRWEKYNPLPVSYKRIESGTITLTQSTPKAENKNVFAFDPIANEVDKNTKWTVTYGEEVVTVPLLGGDSFTARAPLVKEFVHKEEAKQFIKTTQNVNNKIKSDSDSINILRYADLVDAGENIGLEKYGIGKTQKILLIFWMMHYTMHPLDFDHFTIYLLLDII
jgi:hypothetical protein